MLPSRDYFVLWLSVSVVTCIEALPKVNSITETDEHENLVTFSRYNPKGEYSIQVKKISALNESFTCIFPIVYFIMNIKPNGFENRVSVVLIAVGKTSLLAKIYFCYR